MEVGPLDRVSALISEERACFLSLLSAIEGHNEKSATHRRVLIKAGHAGTLISDFQPPEL